MTVCWRLFEVITMLKRGDEAGDASEKRGDATGECGDCGRDEPSPTPPSSSLSASPSS